MNTTSLCPPLRTADPASDFKRIWRGYASGVSLIATEHEGRRFAMLATAVSTVSMDPPALLICVNRSASAHQAIVARGAFSLGVMGAPAQAVSEAIARAATADRFAHGDWSAVGSDESALHGLPVAQEAQATLLCRIETTCSYGTHSVFIARVVGTLGDGDVAPLVYCDGRFAAI